VGSRRPPPRMLWPPKCFPSARACLMPARLLVPHPSRQLGRSRRAATSLVRQRALQHRQWHHRAAGWFATASNPRRSPHEAAVSAQKPLPQSRWASTTRAWVERHRKGLRYSPARLTLPLSMTSPWPGRPYTFRALAKTFGPMSLRCDVCRRYAPFRRCHEIGLALISDQGGFVLGFRHKRRRKPRGSAASVSHSRPPVTRARAVRTLFQRRQSNV
jgi:hypothetical protein